MTYLDAPSRDVLAVLDDVWQNLDEIHAATRLDRHGVVLVLRSLKRRGLATYRRPNGIAGVLRMGEWATTEAGDRAKGVTPMNDAPACWFCKRTAPILDGRYTAIDFGGKLGIQHVCDDCRDRADDPDVIEWRGADVEVV